MAEFETLFISGDRASQPAAAAADQKFYMVTDENNIVERSDGVAWTGWGPGSSGGGLVFVEKLTLTSAAQTMTFTGIDGNTDVNYKLKGLIKVAVNTSTFTLQANGNTTNQELVRFYNGGTDAKSGWEFIGPINSGSWVMLDLDIQAKADPDSEAFKRLFSGTAVYSSGSSTTLVIVVGGMWNDATTNLTSLVLASDVAVSIAKGSSLTLYKYAQS